MALLSKALLLLLCYYQVVLVIGLNPMDEPNDGVISCKVPCEKKDTDAYVQSVQDFWTDERLAAAVPKPMPVVVNNDNTGKFSGSTDETQNEFKEKMIPF